MNPQLALLLCVACVGAALFFDARRRPTSAALWIPTLWAAREATRPLEYWFNPGNVTVFDAAEGSPLDRNVLVALMLAAAIVLARRQLPWARWRREHVWIFAFFVFAGISVVWSDFPGVGFRRWVRAIGTVMMVLVVASEKDPVAATAAVVRRCAIVLLPFSVLLIKYFREYGVYYDFWTYETFLKGATTDKNGLGRLAMVCGLFLVWELLPRGNNAHIPGDRLSRLLSVALLGVALWLLFVSDSKTSLVCFTVGSLVMLLVARPFVLNRTSNLGTVLLVFGGLGLLLEVSFDLSTLVLEALNRDPTLTTRTFIWADLFALRTNPLIGVGYDTFWLGDRLRWFVENHHVAAAHNGYLETYLEMGLIGLFLLVCFLVGVFNRMKVALATDLAYGRLLAAVLAVFLLYNWTESSNKATTFVCFILLLVAMASPRPQGEVAAASEPLLDRPAQKHGRAGPGFPGMKPKLGKAADIARLRPKMDPRLSRYRAPRKSTDLSQ